MAFGPLVLGERPDEEFAIRYFPHQSRLGEDAPAQLHSLTFGALIEHLAPSGRSPPDNHAVRFGQNVGRQYLGLNAATEGAHQKLDECHRERLRRAEGGRRVVAGGHVVAGDETALPVAIDQQSFMQLEAMVLPYR